MLTDWVLTGRLACELDERLRGARVVNAGQLADARVGLVLRSRGATLTMAIDPFASPPLITLEERDLGAGNERGFIGTLARLLHGLRLGGVMARRHDRLLRFTFVARSPFGIDERIDLYAELVPRFGNLVLVKGERIVAALKEFTPAQNPRRAVQAGGPYALPPLAPGSALVAQPPSADAADAMRQPLYVYRRDGELLQAYVVPLARFDNVQCSRAPSLLDVFAELHRQQTARAKHERNERKRRAIAKRLGDRERRLGDELMALEGKRERAERCGALRRQGERIFATLHELADAEREAAKDQAAKLFAEYKKLRKSLPHVEARKRAVSASLAAIATMRWESERAAEEDLDDVQSALAALEPGHRAGERPATSGKRKRPALEFRTPHGSRILVGRSPIENADLTFRVARPNDLWFHTQDVPGAHVILARGAGGAPPAEDLQTAAALAAFNSKAKNAVAVAVDYTLRKYVRKQRGAPPGLVWYTHAKTLVVQPKSL
jgi:predicted ribosome quality control (RQC) complex YloA/Tae2 family protein